MCHVRFSKLYNTQLISKLRGWVSRLIARYTCVYVQILRTNELTLFLRVVVVSTEANHWYNGRTQRYPGQKQYGEGSATKARGAGSSSALPYEK